MKRLANLRAGLLAVLLAAAPAFAAGPVIDVHLHVWPRQWFPAPPHPAVASAQSQEQLIADTVAQMRAHDVVLGLVSAEPGSLDLLVSRDPKRFWALPMLPVLLDAHGEPNGTGTLDLEVLAKKLAAGEWKGLGEISTVYGGLKPDEVLLAPYYDLANRLDVPVFMHSGIGPGGASAAGGALQWESVLRRYPKMRIVLMHAGYPFLDEMIAVMRVYPNVYVDTGAIVHSIPRAEFYRYYGALVQAGLGDRILFGTDQMGWPQSIGYSIETIEQGPWSPETSRDILYNNAARFLRLTDAQIAAHRSK